MRKSDFYDYEGFVDKFKPKKTTDDCYTPAPVYEAVREFVAKHWDIEGREIVRPFYPGGDYERATYPDGCLVLDNPPFSILSRIIRFYSARGVDFFLFAPGLTLFTATDCDCTYIITGSAIKYANGATVKTGFITNLPSDLRIWCCCELAESLEAAQAEPPKTKRGFYYPDNLVTAATLQTLVNRHTGFSVRKDSCVPVKGIDAGRTGRGRDIFGGGFLLSTRAAAERAAAERAAAERAAAERIHLSVRELRIIKKLDENGK